MPEMTKEFITGLVCISRNLEIASGDNKGLMVVILLVSWCAWMKYSLIPCQYFFKQGFTNEN